jgi:hypothetical protein
MSMEKKLTPKQNAVIWCLQNGWEILTDCEMTGALIVKERQQFRINNGLFFRLVNLDLIYQGDWATHRFWYVLTEKGKNIKTKPVTI